MSRVIPEGPSSERQRHPPALNRAIPKPIDTDWARVTLPSRPTEEARTFSPQDFEIHSATKKEEHSLVRRCGQWIRSKLVDLFSPQQSDSFGVRAVRTLGQAGVLVSAGLAMVMAGELFHAVTGVGHVGNASMGTDPETLKISALTVIGLAPLLEEGIFRGIPLLIRKSIDSLNGSVPRGLDLALGIGSALVFGFMHNLSTDPSVTGVQLTETLRLSLEHLPIPQIVMGFCAWQIAKHYGLRWAIGLHMAHNAILIGLASLFV